MAVTVGLTVQQKLNILAGAAETNLDETKCLQILAASTLSSKQDLWNVYAGTSGLRKQDAANVKAGTTGLRIQDAINLV